MLKSSLTLLIMLGILNSSMQQEWVQSNRKLLRQYQSFQGYGNVNPATSAPYTFSPQTNAPQTYPTQAPYTNPPQTFPAQPPTFPTQAPYTYAPVTNPPITNAPIGGYGGSAGGGDMSMATSQPENLIYGISFDCNGKPTGFYRDTRYCDIFHVCVANQQRKTYACPQNGDRFYYDQTLSRCEFASRNPSGCSGSYYQQVSVPPTGATNSYNPVTNQPFTNPPVTNQPYNPVTNPPFTQQPYTNPPFTQQPYTNPPYNPVTNPPYTNPPFTQQPYTNPPFNPVTNPPFTQQPYTNPPYNPVTNPPFTQQPYTNPPFNPVTNPPFNPVTNQPYNNPVTNPPFNPVTNPPFNPATQQPYQPQQPNQADEAWKNYVRQNEQFSCSGRAEGFYPSRWCNVFYRCFNNVKYEFLCAKQTNGDRLWWVQHSTSQSLPQATAQCAFPCDTKRQCTSPGGILAENGNQFSDSPSEASRILTQCQAAANNNNNQVNNGEDTSNDLFRLPSSDNPCVGQPDGAFLADNQYCNIFHVCIAGKRKDFECAKASSNQYDLWWNDATKRCEWPCKVQCSKQIFGGNRQASDIQNLDRSINPLECGASGNNNNNNNGNNGNNFNYPTSAPVQPTAMPSIPNNNGYGKKKK